MKSKVLLTGVEMWVREKDHTCLSFDDCLNRTNNIKIKLEAQEFCN